MTGAEIVGTLLRASPPLAEKVVPANVKLGRLPDNVTLPALLVRTVDVIERVMLKRGTSVRLVERVSVTVRANSYREQVDTIRLVRSAVAGFIGDMEGAGRISVTNAGTGPDLSGTGDSFEQAQDFRVTFDTAA